jgi:hypothetical protein
MLCVGTWRAVIRQSLRNLTVLALVLGAGYWGIPAFTERFLENQESRYYRDLVYSMASQRGYCWELDRKARAEGRTAEAAQYADLARRFREKQTYYWWKHLGALHLPPGNEARE